MPKTMICPFFSCEERRNLYCEAGRFDFASPAARDDYVGRYCANTAWKSCSLALNLLREYERRDNGERR